MTAFDLIARVLCLGTIALSVALIARMAMDRLRSARLEREDALRAEHRRALQERLLRSRDGA